MKVPYPWTLDRSLPSDLFSWQEDDPPVFWGDEIWRGGLAARKIAWYGPDLPPFADLVGGLDDRFGATNRETHGEWELGWRAKAFEIRLSKLDDLIYMEGLREFVPEVQRVNHLLGQSPLREIDARLRSFGELYLAGYSINFEGKHDFIEYREFAHPWERGAVHARAIELGFQEAENELRWRNQRVTFHERTWTASIETDG